MFASRKYFELKSYVIISVLSTITMAPPVSAQSTGQATPPSLFSLFQAPTIARRPDECGLPPSPNNNDGRLPRLVRGGASVFGNGDSSVFVSIRELRVNTDGSPISYHPYDLHGQGEQRKQYGVGRPIGRQPVLNRSCNAVIWAFDGEGPAYCRSRLPEERDADYQKRIKRYYRLIERSRDNGWPSLLLRGPGYPTIDQSWSAIEKGAEEIPADGFVQFDPRVILMTKPDKGRRYPCIRKTGKYKGYFVNQTALDWLVGKTPAEDDASDPAQERDCIAPIKVDPARIPALVIPTGGPYEGATMGDIVIGHNPAANAWVYGIVGDSGNDDIKEASIAFNHALRGGTAPPVASNYQQVVSTFHIPEARQESRRISFLLLPNTRVKFESKYTQAEVRRLAEEAFLRWGGSFDNPAQALLRAKQRFTACKVALSKGGK